MANYNSTAEVVVTVNGSQARKMLSQLEGDAKKLEKGIAAAAEKGDKVTMKKLQKELTNTNRLIDQMRGSAATADDVLRRLDTATPKELQKTLRQLNTQLNSMQRGTEAWDAQVAKIRQVKEELAGIRDELGEEQSLWKRFTGFFNESAAAILGIAGALTGVVAAAKQAVSAYAEMQQEEANVRKYTGMTEEEVQQLQSALKEIDTRTSREELNRLAQDAGRLGKQSQEDVLGFVRAADKINVALDDLGDGATLQLSKLTGIFGDEERLGTEKALLSVGSVINELSQNCSASAPYIAEFTSRMGGVAAQAGMTAQQVMGLAAVLDSNSQALEASATAVSQVIVRIYQEPAKYARVAGIDIKAFTDMVKTDMNGALIMLLEGLQNAGGMDKLSPMFKDMGENGSRAIQALSTLAEHIDAVKAQQEVANVAFAEAVSIDKEFDVQNNTVQAGLDKARNRINEVAVELGQMLMPAMSYVISSSTLLVKGLKATVEFLIEHGRALVIAAAAAAGYYAGSKAIAAMEAVKAAWMARGTALIWLRVTAKKAWRVSVYALNIAYLVLTGRLEMAAVKAKALNRAMMGTPLALVIGLVTALAVAIGTAVYRAGEFSRAMDGAMKKASGFSEEAAKEEQALHKLYVEMKANKEGTERYKNAKDAIIKQYSAYLKGLIDEKGNITDLEAAYNRLTTAIRRNAQAKGIQAARDEITSQYLQSTRKDLEDIFETIDAKIKDEVQAQRIKDRLTDVMVNGENMSATRTMQDKRDEMAFVDAMGINPNTAYHAAQEGGIFNYVASGAFGKEMSWAEAAPWARAQTVDNMSENRAEYLKRLETLDKMEQRNAPYANVPVDKLTEAAETIQKRLSMSRGDIDVPDFAYSGAAADKSVTRQQAQEVLDLMLIELQNRGARGTSTPQNEPEEEPTGPPSSTAKDKYQAEKDAREREEALARIAYSTGEADYVEYTERMKEILVDYYDAVLSHTDIGETERLKLVAERNDAIVALGQTVQGNMLADEEAAYRERLAQAKQYYLDGLYSKETYDEAVFRAEVAHQQALVSAYADGSKERQEAQSRLNDLLLKQQEEAQRKQREREHKIAESKKEFFGDNPAEKQANYDEALGYLNIAYERELEAAQGNADEKLRIEQAYQEAVKALRLKYLGESSEAEVGGYRGAIQKSVDWLNSDGGKAVTGAMSTISSGMSSIFSGMSSLVQAELEMQTAAIEKRYDKEVSRAEGNSYKIAQLEKKKEREIAAEKSKANRKMFAMQVIQAVAQTATNALNAYGSAAAVPVIGYILAPIAAAMAVAAGAIQIATIKKQQQASEAQGYSSGGFTRPGRVDEPAGVVHAGEWVASQRLLANPQARSIIETLDYAQRNNRIGSIRGADLSAAVVTPPASRAVASMPVPTVIVNAPAADSGGDASAVGDAVERLNRRLDEPFVTVNTVEGEHGIHRAYQEYDSLIKRSKSRYKR